MMGYRRLFDRRWEPGSPNRRPTIVRAEQTFRDPEPLCQSPSCATVNGEFRHHFRTEQPWGVAES